MRSTTWTGRPSAVRILVLGLALLLTGCLGRAEPAVIVPERLTVGAAADGRVTVSGAPGAVLGHPFGVTLTVLREGGYTGYRTQHLTGEGFPIVSGFAAVAEDGSFPATVLGDAQNAVKPGDELNARPIRRTVDEGTSVQLSDAGDNVALPIR